MGNDNDVWMFVILGGIAMIIALIIGFFISTKGARLYKKMQYPRMTVGTVTKVQYFSASPGEGDSCNKYEYTFTDAAGTRYENSFKSQKDLYKKGDCIDLYYDSDCPQKNIAVKHLEECRKNYWKYPLTVVLILSISFVVPLLLALFLEKR